MEIEEFLEKYGENIQRYSEESMVSLQTFLNQIETDDIMKLEREYIILFKLLYDVVGGYFVNIGDEIDLKSTEKITRTLNTVLVKNSKHLPDIMMKIQKMQERNMQKMLGGVLDG